jgi:hypothetical protein
MTFYDHKKHLNMLTIRTGGFNNTLRATVCILFVFFYDTLMMVTETTETCR